MKTVKATHIIVLLSLLTVNLFTSAAASFNPPFTETTGGDNPFAGVDVGSYGTPSFADLDGDGDLDAFIGEWLGQIHYYYNYGDAGNPAFAAVTGSSNPFYGVDVGGDSAPSFADLDGDGDLDAFIGEFDGNINYYRNDGTTINPAFTEVTGGGSPFDGVDVGIGSKPSFADVDGDGDLDAFIGENEGLIHYYRNDGATASPNFMLVTGSGNPFNGVDVGSYSTPSFADLDGDGDLDVFIGNVAGVIHYYRNDGTAASPTFTNIGGSEDPFFGVDVGSYSTPSFADLDGDGDLDAFIGNVAGVIHYYRNNRAPQSENLAVTANEDATDDAVDLWPAFQDPDHTLDSSLVYAVIANTNPALFNAVSLTGGQYLNLDYAPDANGAAALTVRGTDPNGLSVTATLQVTVTAVNDAPSFTVGVDPIVAEDSGLVSYPAWATNFSPGPANESSQSPLAYHLESDNPALFTDAPAIDPATGDLSFIPTANAEGTTIITSTVQDDGSTANGGADTSATQTFTITITGVNDAPTANQDSGTGFTTNEDTPFTTDNVLVNDTDPDASDKLSVAGFDTTATLSLVTNNGDGTFDYDPNGQFESLAPGETAIDTFMYTISDSNGGTDIATVTITITGVQDAFYIYLPLVLKQP